MLVMKLFVVYGTGVIGVLDTGTNGDVYVITNIFFIRYRMNQVGLRPPRLEPDSYFRIDF